MCPYSRSASHTHRANQRQPVCSCLRATHFLGAQGFRMVSAHPVTRLKYFTNAEQPYIHAETSQTKSVRCT